MGDVLTYEDRVGIGCGDWPGASDRRGYARDGEAGYRQGGLSRKLSSGGEYFGGLRSNLCFQFGQLNFKRGNTLLEV